MNKSLILPPPPERCIVITYYKGKTMNTVVCITRPNKHITITLEKGLFIVKDDDDTRFVCHAKDLVAMRY